MDVFARIKEQMLGGMSKKPDSASEQPMDEIKLVGFIKNKLEDARMNGSRVAHEAIWMTNIAYLLGFDSVWFDPGTRQFKTLTFQSKTLKRNRLHINKILPTIQNRTARLCKSPPKYDVMPESQEESDKEAARLGLDVLNMLWDKQHIDLKRLQLVMWLQECGHAYMKVNWDDGLGDPIIEAGEDGKEQLTGHVGDVAFEVKSAFQVFCDPLAKTLEEASWVVEANVRKLDYFRERYPEKGDLVKEEGAWLLSIQYEQRINSLTQNGATSGSAPQMKNAAIEMVYYERPSKNYPRGRMCIAANGVLLEDKELPIGEIPLVKFDDVLVAGKYYSEAIITHLRPIQDQLNRVINKRAEWTNRLLNGKFIAPKGHGMYAETLNDQSGEVVEYNPVPGGGMPQAMSIPNIPSYAYAEEEKLNGMLYDISGINEASRGQLPSASIPALGLQILQEQDETRIGIMVEQHELSWARVGQLALKNVSKFYVAPRLLKVGGSSMEYTVKSFQGADLKNNNDVFVVRGSTLPRSKTLKRQDIMNAYQGGLLGDPQDPALRQRVLEELEFGDIQGVWKGQSLVNKQISGDLLSIEGGIAPLVSEFDDHVLHVQKKNEYRLGDKFSRLPPQYQKLLVDNMEAHIQAQMRRMDPNIDINHEMAQNMADQAQQMGPPGAGLSASQPQGGPSSMPPPGPPPQQVPA